MDTLQTAIKESSHRIADVIFKIGNHYPLSNYAINIGAGDGVGLDLVYPLYQSGFSGIAIEANPQLFNLLCQNLPHSVNKIYTKVSPFNIIELLKEAPERPDLIDIDIDGYDYFIAQKVLKLQPKVLTIELQEDVPPGIKFTTLYREDYEFGKGSPWGCSIDMVAALGRNFGYKVLMMDWNTLCLIHEKYAHLFDFPESTIEAYRTGYYDRPERKDVFYWKGENCDLFERPIQEAYQFLTKEWGGYLDTIILELTNENQFRHNQHQKSYA